LRGSDSVGAHHFQFDEVLVMSSGRAFSAEPNLAAAARLGTLMHTKIDQVDSLMAQLTSWSEPVLMLVLGVALLIVATSIRLWGKKRVKNTTNQAFSGVEESGEDLPLFSHGKTAEKRRSDGQTETPEYN